MYYDKQTGELRPHIVRTHFNYANHPSLPRPLTLPSRTIPDQVLTIDEILRRYARDPSSLPPANPVFDSPYPETKGMDRLDKAQLAMDIEQNIHDYQEQVKANKTKKAADAAAAKAASSEATSGAKTEPPTPGPASPTPSTKVEG